MSDNFWDATYRQNIGKMIGVCCRYTHNRQTAEDLAHDAFLVAIDKVGSFENKGPFEAWLRRIVVNVALQHLREQKRQEKWEEAHTYNAIGDALEEEISIADEREFSEAELLEIIGYLPDHHRLVFNLYVIDNFTHAQIAALLGISEGTSKSHLSRARKKIRELLDDESGKNKKRKRAFFWLLFFQPVHTIDYLFARKLKNLAVEPQKRLSADIAHTQAPVPGFKPSGISYATYLKTGLMAAAAAAFLAGGANVRKQAGNDQFIPVIYPKTVLAERQRPARPKFSDLKPATIFENPVIVEKNYNSENMKTLNTLGGLVVASLTLDSANLSTLLPNAFKNQPLIISRIPQPAAVPVNIQPVAKRNVNLISGSFYASKLYWSAENNQLYFLGNRVKVDVSGNKFNGRGKFSFLNEVYYLIIDGTPVKRNDTVQLQEKKYRLITLSESDGARKYGDNGKSGVVEISLAE